MCRRKNPHGLFTEVRDEVSDGGETVMFTGDFDRWKFALKNFGDAHRVPFVAF